MKLLSLPIVLVIAAAALPGWLRAQSPSPSPATDAVSPATDAASPAATGSAADSPAAAAATPDAAADLSQYKTADALWTRIEEIQKGPSVAPKTEEEAKAVMGKILSQLNEASGKFVKSYPDDPHRWEAQMLQVETQADLDEGAGHPDAGKYTAGLQEIAGQKDAPAEIRREVRMKLIVQMVDDYVSGKGSATSASIAEGIDQFAKDFPKFMSMDELEVQIGQAVKGKDAALSDKLIKEGTDAKDKKEAALKKKLEAPLDIHFTAVDGTKVDLATMRGKVVLVDFWATWCGPCVAEMPDVVATYKKLHDQGFEIVGISLDQDKAALTKFLQAHEMTWPQYFDGNGWENEISSKYGIDGIPAMWIVNKKGIVASMDGGTDLEGQVRKLLAE